MRNKLRLLMAATALLYIGPLLAGMGGYGWTVTPIFLVLFLIWLFVLRPQVWPSEAAEWRRSPAWAKFATQATLQLLLVAMLFGVGRGIGAFGVVHNIPLLLPIVISALSIPLGRLIWNPHHASQMDDFLDDAIRRVALHDAPNAAADLDHARRMITPLADLPDSTPADEVARHLSALAAHADESDIRTALLERQRTGHASHAETLALILHATDATLIEIVGGDGPTLALAVLPQRAEFIALYASRLAAALTEDAELWGQCPTVERLEELAEHFDNTEAEAPLRALIAATNAAQPEDGLA